jgi:hypothetical protein
LGYDSAVAAEHGTPNASSICLSPPFTASIEPAVPRRARDLR